MLNLILEITFTSGRVHKSKISPYGRSYKSQTILHSPINRYNMNINVPHRHPLTQNVDSKPRGFTYIPTAPYFPILAK